MISECGHRIFPKGALIRYWEWYGCPRLDGTRWDVNKGIRLTSTEVAQGILQREEEKMLLGKGSIQVDRVADPSIFGEKDGPSISEKMAAERVIWRRAENKRISGWDQVRGRLKGQCVEVVKVPVTLPDGTVEERVVSETWEPMLYVTENCEHLIRTLPIQERDSTDWEDVDTDGEDHAADELRYVCMSRPRKGLSFEETLEKKPLYGCAADIAEAVGNLNSGLLFDDGMTRANIVGGGSDFLSGTDVYLAR